ncbi:unnamed protein product [Diplocarpon coronariae]
MPAHFQFQFEFEFEFEFEFQFEFESGSSRAQWAGSRKRGRGGVRRGAPGLARSRNRPSYPVLVVRCSAFAPRVGAGVE